AGMVAIVRGEAAAFSARLASAIRTLCGAEDIEPELKLAAMYLIGDKGDEEAVRERSALARGAVTDAEWDALYGLKMWAGGRPAEARRRFVEAMNACEKSRQWPAHIMPELLKLSE
ncbi:MAG: hypothetical protein N3A38_13805, partial [Planctomycetota bacterium]|nr:hypothetical protein [Planctomycetota bacterium]